MKRIQLLVLAFVAAFLLTLGVRASSAAPLSAITPGVTALQIAQAMTANPAWVTGATFVTQPPISGAYAVSDTALTSFPVDGSTYGVLTTGRATNVGTPNIFSDVQLSGTPVAARGNTAYDVTTLRIGLNVPANYNCLSIDFQFLSEEYPVYVGTNYNDAFIAELDTSNWTTSGSVISAPNNFAFDTQGNVVSINSTGVTGMTSANGAGTAFNGGTNDGGATVLLRASTPALPGAHNLYLSIFDQGDARWDSAVFLDNLTLGYTDAGECVPGAQPAPPAANAGISYSGDEGAPIAIDNATASDPNDDPLTYLWTADSLLCSFNNATLLQPTLTCGDDGVYTITLEVSDGTDSSTSDAEVTVNNLDPTVAADNANVTVDEGQTASNSGSYGDVPADTVSLSVDVGNITDNNDGTWSWSYDTTDGPSNSGTVTITAEDEDGGSSTTTFDLTVNNVAPTVAADNASVTVDEGQTANNSGSYGDVPADTVSLSVDVGSITDNNDGTWSWSYDTTDGPSNSGTVTITAEDEDGGSSTTTFDLTVNNVAPTVDEPTVLPEPSIEGDPATASATFSDPGDDDSPFTCTVDYGDGAGEQAGTVAGGTCTGPAYVYATPGSYTVTVAVTDKDNETGSSSTTHVVDPRNTPPTAEAGGPYSGDEGAPIALDGTGSSDPDNDPLSYEWSVDNPVLCSFDNNLSATPNLTCDDNGSYTVTVSVSDNIAPAVTDTASVTVNNVAPTASFGNNGPVDEGTSFELSLTSPYDPSSADTTAGFEYAFDCGDGSGYGAYGPTATATCATTDSGTRNVNGKIRDKDSGETEYLASVTVNNVAPTITSFEPTTLNPIVAINELVEFQATFTDPAGSADEDYTCAFDATDDGTADYSVTDADYGACSGSVSYAAPGVYTASLIVTDKDGGASTKVTYQFDVVYDPAAGFVTGGGWIDSPEGAYTADASLTGKASFGFVAKYKKGQTTPDGNTQFQFKAGDLNFHSTSYDWLIVAGANAKFKGVGTINGAGEYSFMITATDGDLLGGGQADGFRIKIWDAGGTVYDNQMGQGDDSNDTTDLGGGSIVIHNK